MEGTTVVNMLEHILTTTVVACSFFQVQQLFLNFICPIQFELILGLTASMVNILGNTLTTKGVICSLFQPIQFELTQGFIVFMGGTTVEKHILTTKVVGCSYFKVELLFLKFTSPIQFEQIRELTVFMEGNIVVNTLGHTLTTRGFRCPYSEAQLLKLNFN